MEEREGEIYLACTRDLIRDFYAVMQMEDGTLVDLDLVEYILEYIPIRFDRHGELLELEISLETFMEVTDPDEAILDLTFVEDSRL